VAIVTWGAVLTSPAIGKFRLLNTGSQPENGLHTEGIGRTLAVLRAAAHVRPLAEAGHIGFFTPGCIAGTVMELGTGTGLLGLAIIIIPAVLIIRNGLTNPRACLCRYTTLVGRTIRVGETTV